MGPHHRRVERGTGFSELIDPVVQREILTAQSPARRRATRGDAARRGLPPSRPGVWRPPMGGLGLGIDRLVMLFTGANIRETILFPLLKPEE